MNDDTFTVPTEDRILVIAPEEWTIEIPAEWRVIEVSEPCF